MFQFPHLPPTCRGSSWLSRMGLPHSEMMGSRPDCGSSIVSLLVCVLRRLVVPRHPPTAHHVLPGHGVLGGRGQCPRHNQIIFTTNQYELVKVHLVERRGLEPRTPC